MLGSEILPYIYKRNNPATQTVIFGVHPSSHGVETPLPSVDCCLPGARGASARGDFLRFSSGHRRGFVAPGTVRSHPRTINPYPTSQTQASRGRKR